MFRRLIRVPFLETTKRLQGGHFWLLLWVDDTEEHSKQSSHKAAELNLLLFPLANVKCPFILLTQSENTFYKHRLVKISLFKHFAHLA